MFGRRKDKSYQEGWDEFYPGFWRKIIPLEDRRTLYCDIEQVDTRKFLLKITALPDVRRQVVEKFRSLDAAMKRISRYNFEQV